MIEAVGTAVALFIPFAGWVLAIQSKVSAQEIQLEAQKELILSKLDNIAELMQANGSDLDRRLSRIERAMNGHLRDVEDNYGSH